ncbi:hypothetical protein NQD34_003086 [Periophthalmus magnuspinnatus]|nr:hypothetical protein NQD34_003086 [Periophthalmus magnuspinnatus]
MKLAKERQVICAKRQGQWLAAGDGAIRNVSHRIIQTSSYPSHTVSEITKLLPKVLSTHRGVKQLIVQVGEVDTGMEQTEIFKKNFIKLFEELGLFNAYVARGLHFIENFDLFWKREDLFKGNGPHLSRGGVRVPSALTCSLTQTPPCFTSSALLWSLTQTPPCSPFPVFPQSCYHQELGHAGSLLSQDIQS